MEKENTYTQDDSFDAKILRSAEGGMDLNHKHFSFECSPRVISILDLGILKKEERYLMQWVFAAPLIGADVIFKRNPPFPSSSRRFLDALACTRTLNIVPFL